MPSAQDILTRIKNLSLVGSGGAADDERIMGYLNLVYAELYRETATQYPEAMMTSESVSVTSGSGTITSTPFAILRVKNATTGRFLEPKSLMEIEKSDPAMTSTASAAYYYLSGRTGLRVYPLETATFTVRYVPQFTPLTSTTAESAITIPAEFHDAFVWGTLMYMAYDERDKGMVPELQVSEPKFRQAKNAFTDWLLTLQPHEPIRTEAVMA